MKNKTTIQFLHPKNTSGIENHIFVVSISLKTLLSQSTQTGKTALHFHGSILGKLAEKYAWVENAFSNIKETIESSDKYFPFHLQKTLCHIDSNSSAQFESCVRFPPRTTEDSLGLKAPYLRSRLYKGV